MNPMTYVVLTLVSIWMSGCLSKPSPEVTDDDTLNIIDNKDSNYRAQYAAKMLSYMNLSVQPCDDFYEYACGNWKNTIQERQCEKHRNNFFDIGYKVDDFIGQIMQRADINDVAPEYAEEFELAKKFYNNCLETEFYPKRKSSEYLKIIEKIGGFPAVNPHWNASEFNWINMSAHLSNYGAKTLINEVCQDSYPFTPFFILPDFGFDIELHFDTINNVTSKEYQLNQKRMHDILTIYGVSIGQMDHVIEKIFDFLKATLNIVREFQEDLYTCHTMGESWLDSLLVIRDQWRSYFDIAWKGKSVTLGFGNGPCIYFYQEFDKIVEMHQEAIANYLSLKFLYHMDANRDDSKFQKDYCTSSLKKSMSFLFDQLYMKISFNEDIADDVRKMAREVRRSLQIVLQEAQWLDDDTRQAALLKEAVTGLHIGRYEDSQLYERILGELKNLKFVDGNHDANRINLARYSSYMTRYLGLHSGNTSTHTRPIKAMLGIEANAFYNAEDNNMYISASVLQPPTYHQTWPKSLKYGTLGVLLGHEITHGYDTTGAYYDQYGRYKNWWSSTSKQYFNERARCFVGFYSNYTVPEINRNINGEETKDENIADAGALHLALLTYRRHAGVASKKFDARDTFSKEELGIDATPEQLFFLGAAQVWCSAFKDADYWRQIVDTHTIDKYRVLGMVSNSEDFAKAYNCPLGSNMNPTVNKCKIW